MVHDSALYHTSLSRIKEYIRKHCFGKYIIGLWSRSYYAGSVGAVSESVVRRYIEAQKGA